jgi:hypothetical protein
LLCCHILSIFLDDHVVGIYGFNNSLHWHSWSEVEWSVDLESVFFIKSLSILLSSFIKIDDVPFLVIPPWFFQTIAG